MEPKSNLELTTYWMLLTGAVVYFSWASAAGSASRGPRPCLRRPCPSTCRCRTRSGTSPLRVESSG